MGISSMVWNDARRDLRFIQHPGVVVIYLQRSNMRHARSYGSHTEVHVPPEEYKRRNHDAAYGGERRKDARSIRRDDEIVHSREDAIIERALE